MVVGDGKGEPLVPAPDERVGRHLAGARPRELVQGGRDVRRVAEQDHPAALRDFGPHGADESGEQTAEWGWQIVRYGCEQERAERAAGAQCGQRGLDRGECEVLEVFQAACLGVVVHVVGGGQPGQDPDVPWDERQFGQRAGRFLGRHVVGGRDTRPWGPDGDVGVAGDRLGEIRGVGEDDGARRDRRRVLAAGRWRRRDEPDGLPAAGEVLGVFGAVAAWAGERLCAAGDLGRDRDDRRGRFRDFGGRGPGRACRAGEPDQG